MDGRLELQLNLSFLGRLRVFVLLCCLHECLCAYAVSDGGREGGREGSEEEKEGGKFW